MSSLRCAIQFCRSISREGYVNVDDPPNATRDILIGVGMYLCYVGLACDFYAHVTSLNYAFGENCSSINATNFELNLKYFCENAFSWEVCGMLVIVWGLLYVFFGCIVICNAPDVESDVRLKWQNMLGFYDFFSQIGTVAIFVTLLNSEAIHVEFEGFGFHKAVICFFIGIVIETVVWFFTLCFLIWGVYAWCLWS